LRKVFLIFVVIWIHADAGLLDPYVDVSFCFNPLFPSNQKMYYPDQFDINNGLLIPIEKQVKIKDYVNWMPGYTLEARIGKLSVFGIDLKFENYFNSYIDSFSNSGERFPVDLKIFELSGGIFATLKINEKIFIEPNLNFLYVSHQEYLSLSRTTYNYYGYNYNDFPIDVEKFGLTSTLKVDYIYNDKIEFNGKLKIIYWPHYFDCFVNPNLNYSISHFLKSVIGVEYSPINKSIKPIIGAQISLRNR
jgi:hypothetical protein